MTYKLFYAYYPFEVTNVIKCLKYDGGINGYFYASVPSQTFENGTHAVVVDS